MALAYASWLHFDPSLSAFCAVDFESGRESQPFYGMWVTHCVFSAPFLCSHLAPPPAVSDHPANASPAFDLLFQALRKKIRHMILVLQSLVCLMSDQAANVLCPASGSGPVAGTVPLLCLWEMQAQRFDLQVLSGSKVLKKRRGQSIAEASLVRGSESGLGKSLPT